MKFERIPIHKVDLDRQNPRITQFQSAEQSFDTNEESNDWLQNILLQPHGSEEYGPNSDELQKSIRAAGTIIEPVILIKDKGRYTCIEGNTRLAIYRKFSQLPDISKESDWSTIPALVHTDMEKDLIDNLRLQAHFVGKKEWTPYSKGLFIYQLIHAGRHLEDIKKIVGGSDSKIAASLAAYHLFQDHYVPLFNPEKDNQHPKKQKFGQFYEYCRKASIRDALADHAGSEKKASDTFARWVKKDKFSKIFDIRKLPEVLADKDAKKAFVSGDTPIAEVISQYLTSEKGNPLDKVSIYHLSDELGARLADLKKNNKKLVEKDMEGLDYLKVELSIFFDSED